MIGSRSASMEHCIMLEETAKMLLSRGAKGYSGAASGPDTAYTNAVIALQRYNEIDPTTLGRIYIPWAGFSGFQDGDLHGVVRLANTVPVLKEKAVLIARLLHGAYHRLTRGGKALHSRNPYQVLGDDLASPVSVVLCAADTTNRGAVKGGTATAVKLAQSFEIPVINIATDKGKRDLTTLLTLVDKIDDTWNGIISLDGPE